MVKSPQSVDFIVEQVLFDLVLNFCQFDYLNCHLLIILLVDSFVNFRAETRPNHIRWIVDEVLDLFGKFLFISLVGVSCWL
jgi:hypothetical protein